jgi:hypothetical protein
LLKEKVKEDKEAKKMDRGQLSKKKKTPTDDLEHFTENKEGQDGEALKMWVKWIGVLDLGF